MLEWTDTVTGEARAMTREDLDAELSPSRWVDSLDDELNRYADLSAKSRALAAQDGYLDEVIPYADSVALDLLRPRTDRAAPLLIYVHGGFWQQLSRRESAFAGAHVLAAGGALAAVGYTLAPAASLTQIVAEVRAAVAFLYANAEDYGLDCSRFVIAGSSAGAHLAAMVIAADGSSDTHDLIHGAVLVSGVYNLQAVIRSYVNDVAGITEDESVALSPARWPAACRGPVTVAYGEREPSEFKRESLTYATHLNAH
ncbi:MAG: alpha/beta hydrolase, partial [Pseudomonadota bacterium]